MPSYSPIILETITFSVILGVALVFFAVMSFIFSYHWRRFGVDTKFFRRMTRLYFVISNLLAISSVLLFIRILSTF
jgi:hypothetical protein